MCPPEFWDTLAPLGTNSLPLENFQSGFEQNLDVEPQGAIVYVPDIQLELFLPIKKVPAAHDDRAGHARLHLMPAHLLRGIKGKVFHEQRPRSYNTHIALEHIPELRDLIQGQASKESTQPRQTLLIGEQVALFIPKIKHGAKLIHHKRLSVKPGAHLAKDHRRPHRQSNGQGHRQSHR